jgi:hypothetical protein
MAKFLHLALQNASGLTQHTEELKTCISIHNIDAMLLEKRKQLGITVNQKSWLLKRKSKLSTSNKLLILDTQTNLDIRNRTLEYGFHFQHRKSRMLPIESLVHDSGRTLVRAEYGYPKESPNANS